MEKLLRGLFVYFGNNPTPLHSQTLQSPTKRILGSDFEEYTNFQVIAGSAQRQLHGEMLQFFEGYESKFFIELLLEELREVSYLHQGYCCFRQFI